ncbi:hypothetical protein Gohar_002366 [Gossypium harknessii]|uniref:Uncharacterized protein n=1 Tax=Gossypium harknessii TaxID=34285 RepID=A0A7J9HKT8_9ROSI|nr:hypothetical protein [Gossypium harknessii]
MIDIWVSGLRRKEDNKRYQWLGFKATIVNRREAVDVVASTVTGLDFSKVGVHNQVVAPTYQEAAAPKEKLPFKRKPTTIRWMPSTQKSSVSDPSMTL